MASPAAKGAPDAAAARAKRKGLLVRLTVAPAVLGVVLALLWWHDASGSSRPTVPMMRLPVGNPNSATSDWRATSSAGRKRSRRMPLGTDSSAWRGRTPWSTKHWRAASHTPAT